MHLACHQMLHMPVSTCATAHLTSLPPPSAHLLRHRIPHMLPPSACPAVIDGDEIVYRDYVDISIAVATPKGLVVPVLRNADKLTFATCEKVRPCLMPCPAEELWWAPVTCALQI